MSTALPKAESRYDVSLDPATLGLLLDDARAEERGSEGARCWEVLGGRKEPCVACPLLARDLTSLPAVVPDPRQPGGVRVLNADVDGDVAHVVTWLLAPATVTHLVRLRLESLVERARLTLQERRVLDRIVLGTASKEVAHELGISPRTVKFHAGNAFKKLGAQSRQDLLRLLLVAEPPASTGEGGAS